MSGSLRRLAGLVSSPAAKIKRARALLEDGKGAEGFRALAPVAQAGNAEAQFLVARCYLEGNGVPPSAQEGARWMEMAASQGYLQAQSTLAALYLRGLAGLGSPPARKRPTPPRPARSMVTRARRHGIPRRRCSSPPRACARTSNRRCAGPKKRPRRARPTRRRWLGSS